MSMLAERKRKTNWVIHPTKKPLWTTDSNGIEFGMKLMEKMGWSAGKGLGANEQGIQEPIKASYKNDTKGMGFKSNDDQWIEHQDEFNILLDQLRNDSSVNISNTSLREKNEIKSLEEKSKQSRARVHYQKFTRGKDLSRYSENDLACILGTNKLKKKSEEIIQINMNNDNSFETSFGVTTINSGSVQDYFKKKWTFDKKPSVNINRTDENFCESSSNKNFDFVESLKPKAENRNRKRQYESEVEEKNLELNGNITFESEKNKKMKKNKNQDKPKENFYECTLKDETIQYNRHHLNDEKKNLSTENENDNSDLVKKRIESKNCGIFEDEKKSDYFLKKKRKICSENNKKLCTDVIVESGNLENLKMKEHKDIKSYGSCIVECKPDDCTTEQVTWKVGYKKKKKKDKKEKLDVDKEVKDINFFNNPNGELIEVGYEKKSSKKKKVKEKLEDNTELKNTEFSNCSDPFSYNQNSNVNEVNLKVKMSEKIKRKSKMKKLENIEEAENTQYPNNQNDEGMKLNLQEEASKEKIKKKKKILEDNDSNEVKIIEGFHCSNSHSNNQNTKVFELNIEDSNKKKKRKKEHNEKVSSIDYFSNQKDEVNEFSLKVKSSKKKDKKKKTEDSNQTKKFLSYCEIPSNDQKCEDFELGFEIKSRNKKKKENRKKTEYNEQIRDAKLSSKIYSNEVELCSEIESIKEKKTKKKKKSKEYKEIKDKEHYSFTNTLLNDKNKNSIESDERKKNKKTKKEKLKNNEMDDKNSSSKDSFYCNKEAGTKKINSSSKENVLVESMNKKVKNSNIDLNKEICSVKASAEKKSPRRQTDILEVGLFKKRKKDSQEEPKHAFKKKSVENKKLIQKHSKRSVKEKCLTGRNNVINNLSEKSGVHKHKVEFLNEKRADKFYSGRHKSKRVQRLLCWVNFSEFKGSNIESVTGYGCLLKCENKPR